jgi:hypothetical protein
MSVYQDIFNAISPNISVGWKWFRLRAFYTDLGATYLLDFGLTSDREKAIDDGTMVNIQKEMAALRDEITPHPMQPITHVELTYTSDGKFESLLGYGKPNLDFLPIPWPDDITAENYTYVNAWPTPVMEKRAELCRDPRSLLGVNVIPNE